jgi:SAM-dependent methyltransferase
MPAVMDVGCGYPWKFALMIRPVAGRQLLVDQPSTASLVRELCPGADFLGVDLEQIDGELRERFDLVICADVLEHLVDPDPCVAFIRRHLSASGWAVFSTPERDFLRGRGCDHCPKREHVREWNSDEFRAYLRSRGLTVVEQRWFPQRRLTGFEYGLSRVLGPRCWPRRWASCQMAVCRANALAEDMASGPSSPRQRAENP